MIAPAWTALNMQPSDLRSDMQELVSPVTVLVIPQEPWRAIYYL